MPTWRATASNGAPSSGREIGDDDTGRPGACEAAQHGLPIASTDDLVRVAHRDDREVRSGGPDSLDQPQRAVERRTSAKGDLRRALQGRAVGERVAVRQPDLEDVGAGVGHGEGDVEPGLRIGIAGHHVRDEGGSALGAGSREHVGETPGAGGLVRAERDIGGGARRGLGVGRGHRDARHASATFLGAVRAQAPSMISWSTSVRDTRELDVDPAEAADIRRVPRRLREGAHQFGLLTRAGLDAGARLVVGHDHEDLVADAEGRVTCVLLVAPGRLFGRLGERQTQRTDLGAGHRALAHGSTSSKRARAARSLSPRPEKPSRTSTSGRPAAGQVLDTGEDLGQRRDRVGRLERREDALGPGRGLHRGDRLAVGGGGDLEPAGLGERRELRADARVIEAGRCAVRLDHLAVAVLEHQRPRPVEDARGAAEDGRRVLAGLDAVTGCLGDREPDRRLADEPCQEPDRVRAAADAGDRELGQATLDRMRAGRPPRRRSGAAGHGR